MVDKVDNHADCIYFEVGTCRIGVDADMNAANPAIREGVMMGNSCPFEGQMHEAEHFCPNYE